MKKSFYFGLILVALLSGLAGGRVIPWLQQDQPSPGLYAPDHILIKFYPGVSDREKNETYQIVRLAAEYPLAFVTNAEVLQELLHHYLALRLWAQLGNHCSKITPGDFCAALENWMVDHSVQ